MQSLIDSLRSDSADNILLPMDWVLLSIQTRYFPLCTIGCPTGLPWSCTYVNSVQHVDINHVEDYLGRRFGDTAIIYPIIATE